MSFTLHGLAVSQGIAIGRAHLVSHATLEVAHYTVRERDVPREIERLEEALTLNPDLGEGWHNKGLVLERLGREEGFDRADRLGVG